MKELLRYICAEIWKSAVALTYLAAVAILGYVAILAGIWICVHTSWIVLVVVIWLVICTFLGVVKWIDAL